ncbi:unnamed protein product [Oncorhynchus mykiss]|uniref:EF-hand domain-containing protein n=1 Tax=Oncorhynchus mykiss TaxID=8022 RepID=A0A060W914_ONCMY|nr:unnamed protein product [Oncorhynchus mykiss]
MDRAGVPNVLCTQCTWLCFELLVPVIRCARQAPVGVAYRYVYITYSTSLYSVEDDFELSTVCHRPEGLDKLQEQTKFTKKELQVLYRGFKNVNYIHSISIWFSAFKLFNLGKMFRECPSGVVNEDTFKTIYSKFFPQGDSGAYAHFLFEAFDTNKNGSVSFEVRLFLLLSTS